MLIEVKSLYFYIDL